MTFVSLSNSGDRPRLNFKLPVHDSTSLWTSNWTSNKGSLSSTRLARCRWPWLGLNAGSVTAAVRVAMTYAAGPGWVTVPVVPTMIHWQSLVLMAESRPGRAPSLVQILADYRFCGPGNGNDKWSDWSIFCLLQPHLLFLTNLQYSQTVYLVTRSSDHRHRILKRWCWFRLKELKCAKLNSFGFLGMVRWYGRYGHIINMLSVPHLIFLDMSRGRSLLLTSFYLFSASAFSAHLQCFWRH